MDSEGQEVAIMQNTALQDQDKCSDEPEDESSFSGKSGIPRKPSIMKDNSRKNSRKKTVSFSSFPEDKPISKVSDCIAIMQAGSELIKLRAPSRQFHRIFSLSEDHQEIKWHPSSKKPDRARVLVDNIKEVRLGKNTETFRICDSSSVSFPEDCSFSIIFGDNYQSLDLVASSPDEANIWVTGLAYLTGTNRTPEAVERNQDMRDRWLHDMFEKAAGTSVGQLDEFEVMQLMKKLNNGVASTRVRQRFKEMTQVKKRSGDAHPTLSSLEFLDLFKEMSTRPEIYFLLVRYASGEYMAADDLLMFLEAEQGMTGVTKERCLQLTQKYEPSVEGREKGHLGIDGFTKYLLSQECDVFDPKHHKVCQDMTHSLSHYYIASSHNTYLIEDQLKGPSSVEAYISALQKGCRWVELDCWDGNNNEPVIYHGHTFTSKILFKDVIEAINKHSFETSEFPVILSLENHCSIQQQRVMAKYLTSILKDKLYIDRPNQQQEFLPSPMQLRHKILIKAKKLPVDFGEDIGDVTDEDEGQDLDDKKRTKDILKRHPLIKELSDLVSLCKSVRFQGFQEAASNQKYWELCSFSEAQSQRLLNTDLEEFVNYNKRFLSRVFPNANRIDSSNYNPQDLWNCGCQIVALNYQTPGLMTDLYDGKFRLNGGCGYILKPQTCIVVFIVCFLCAVALNYQTPGLMTDLYDGKFRLNGGCGYILKPQTCIVVFIVCFLCAVALNYQTPGLMTDLYDGKFRLNGGCGYILKPHIMREEISYFSAHSSDIIPGVSPQILHIKIISGQQFPKPRGSEAKGNVIDPYISMEIFGIPADCAEERTKTVSHNGHHPIFDESFEFTVNLPEQALVRFVVLDDEYIGDEFIGQYTIPFECLQPGYRHFTLLSNTGESLAPASLFVHIAITNKRGGGKPSRRGMSVKRMKNSKKGIRMRQVGVKGIDETFKNAIAPFRESFELRDKVQSSCQSFKDSCGLASIANLKQCTRVLASRAVTAGVKLRLNWKEDMVILEVIEGSSEIVAKSLTVFEAFTGDCTRLTQQSIHLLASIEEVHRGAMDSYESLSTLLQKEGLRGKKLAKAMEGFAWNIRVLKGQMDILSFSRKECFDWMRQVYDAGTAFLIYCLYFVLNDAGTAFII
ncbi:inactive phospholipase C-like protein 2 isoform X2 [Apostichopus japonicus]|uniref:inactive phospholipase C-like protein 2 isoform X2 n=1 Tax=Stichopus japonicus TaxID=307972 RepID=UPI003AB7DE06